jgi:hypothetical protein
MGEDSFGRTFKEEFMLQEHEALQGKMSRSAADLWRIETIVPLAIAALYAWFAKEGGHLGHISSWLLWVPVGLVVFGACRQELRYRYINVVEEYLIRLETAVYGETGDLRGWENHWKVAGSYGNRHARRVVWGVVFIASVLIALNGRELYAPQADSSTSLQGAPITPTVRKAAPTMDYNASPATSEKR